MLNKFLFSGAIAHSVPKSENYWHFTSSRREKCTTSLITLHPLLHFVPNGTSSHKTFHPICYFILYVTSSHRSFHPIRHFILWLIVHESFNPTSDFIPVNISRLILFFHFIPPTTFTPPSYISFHPGYHLISITNSFEWLPKWPLWNTKMTVVQNDRCPKWPLI